MKAVGVKELKAHLSHYVRLARGGETILVTDRDEVVAEIRASRRALRGGSELQETLEALSETRELTRANIPIGSRRLWRTKGLGLRKGTATAILDAIREDR